MRGNPLRSIQGKLTSLYLLLTLGSLATLTFLSYETTGRILSSSIRSQLQTIAEGKSDLISRWMEEREHDVEVLAKNTTVTDVVRELAGADPGEMERSGGELTALLRLVRDQYGAYHEIAVIDLAGRTVATTNGTPTGTSDATARLLDTVRQGRHYISEIHLYGEGLPPSLDIAIPVTSGNGDALGAVIAKINIEIVNEMTDSMRLMESGEAYLVDQRGVFITHRDRRRVFRDDISAITGVSAVIGGRSGVGEYVDYRGVDVLGAFEWLPRWRWGLLVEIDREEAFAPVNDLRWDLLLIVALIATTVLFGTLLVARRIVRPLRELTGAVQAVASGRMDMRLDIAGHDEVSYLSESFNHMTSALEKSHAEMDERVQQATDRVARKNEELEEANRNLAQSNQELSQANLDLEEQRGIAAHSARLATFGEMAAGIAHEINNPLTTMKNLIHSLQAGLPPDDIRQKDIGIVAEEIGKLTKLVRNFLTFARPTKGDVTAIDLNAIGAKALALVEPQARQKGLRVRERFDEPCPAIMADREQLEQVALNLLLNAIQASPEGGDLEIFSRTTIGPNSGAPKQVELGVTDHGPGVAAADRASIFRPFFTTKSRGSGLGLAISQRIVEEHGGEIHLTSKPGDGATFVVSLPVVGEE